MCELDTCFLCNINLLSTEIFFNLFNDEIKTMLKRVDSIYFNRVLFSIRVTLQIILINFKF